MHLASGVHSARRILISSLKRPHPLLIRCSSARHEHTVVFYRWPTMRQFRFISRFKVYQVSTVLLLLPPITYWYTQGQVGGGALVGAWLAGLGTTAVFCVLSSYLRRFVGEMAYTLSSQTLRVSTLTFMGGRRDLLFPVERVVPFGDAQSAVETRAFQRLEVEAHPEVLYYSLKYGLILDRHTFNTVMGTHIGTESPYKPES